MKFLSLVLVVMLGGLVGCDLDMTTRQPESASGVTQARVQVKTGSDGLTAEQRNVGKRLLEDNKPGSIKHLYVISAYSGQVLIYSTVQGKVTSGGKRLTPTTIVGGYSQGGYYGGFPTTVGGREVYTSEVLQDDGTYGHSGDYLYWWDTKGVYHQHYLSGGQILHISTQPLSVKSVVINMELTKVNEEPETPADPPAKK